ncbi:11015_t:CDS:2, partial [Diversispora eburnea]
MSRDKFATRIINLPFGITAKEIISNIKTIGALTCYIPRSLNYRHRSEAIILFVSEEVLETAIGKEWKASEFNIKVTSMAAKTCYRCHSEEHIAKDFNRFNKLENFVQDKLNLNPETNQYHSDYNEPEVDSQMDFDKLNLHNLEGSEELKSKNENKFGRLLQVVEQFDIVGIAETNYSDNKGQWYKDNKDKFRIHCSDNGKGTGVALIISKTLNKYIYKKRGYGGRAICVDLVLPRKMTICVMQIYLPTQRKKKKVIVMEDFNAVPSPAIDQNNNSHSHFSESEIFPLLSSHDLIDCYKIMFSENIGYTWKRDNSNEESRIDAIWILHRWSDKITSCFLDNIKFIHVVKTIKLSQTQLKLGKIGI